MARSDIIAAYQKYLGREPDAAGLEYWSGNLSSGTESLDSIISNIQNSAEAQTYTAPPPPPPAPAVQSYRYNYDALMTADATNNNFLPLSQVKGTADYNNDATALLEAKGLIANTPEVDAFIANANAAAGDSTVAALQNLAGLSESDTAVARGDTWGGSDDTMGKSWLEKIVAGDLDTSNISVEDLYQTGFGRAPDVKGKEHWDAEHAGGSSIQDIAKSFLASEEATYRTGYHENYGRDADQAGLDYWMTSGGTEEHWESDTSADFNRILQHTGDEYEQKETSVRNRLSAELGLHSSDAQRFADPSLAGADGISGTEDDVFVDASEADVNRMVASDDLGAEEVSDKVKMQSAAQYMGDYGGGVDDVGATNIHRMLANEEMGTVVTEATGDKWVSDPEMLRKTGSDYLPQTSTSYDSEGNPLKTNTHNYWGLLKNNTQDYDKADVEKVLPEIEGVGVGVGPITGPGTGPITGPGTGPGTGPVTGPVTGPGTGPVTGPGTGNTNKIKVVNERRDYRPELVSNIKDESTYGTSKELFDSTAKGITTPGVDTDIRNVPTENVGGSAKGVRLKRSRKFKSGASAQGTKQLGRQMQIKSLNI